jgi:predicted membrane protein
MKMGAGLFWGIILIIIGLSIILRLVFDVNIVRIVVAILFILIGVRLLVGGPVIHHQGDENQVIFGERNYNSDPVHGVEYNTIFGKTVYDFRQTKLLPEKRTRIKFNTVFGSTEVFLPPEMAVRLKADAVFATASMPNGNTVAFGSTTYESHVERTDTSLLVIDASVVFGSLIVKQ